MEQRKNYIVFKDGDLWISRFFKKGFSHIQIVACDEFNWIVLDPSSTHLDWEILPFKADDNPFEEYFKNCTVVSLNNIENKSNWIGRVGFMSCVLLAKYVFGIKSHSLTPYQLYKYIIKNKLGEVHGTVRS